MNEFDNYVDSLLMELPYVDYISKFDFRLEDKQDVNEFIESLKNVLNGGEERDNKGNLLYFENPEQKLFFLKNLFKDPIIRRWMTSLPNDESKKIKDFLKHIITPARSQYY